jgi:uncharacterized protein YjeT (DUF2065 family)
VSGVSVAGSSSLYAGLSVATFGLFIIVFPGLFWRQWQREAFGEPGAGMRLIGLAVVAGGLIYAVVPAIVIM